VSGCVPPDEYIKLMSEVGFDGARCEGSGDFWTSPTTRSMDFVGVKAAAPIGSPRKALLGLKVSHLALLGGVTLATMVLARLWNKRT